MHQVKYINQFFLAVFLVVLGFGTYWWEFKKKPEDESKEQETKKALAGIKDAQIKSIRIFNAKKNRTFEIQCGSLAEKECKAESANSKWTIVQPQELQADTNNMSALLRSLTTLSFSGTIDLSQESPESAKAILKDYALNPENRLHASVMQITTEEKTFSVYLGIAPPLTYGNAGETVTAFFEQNPEKLAFLPQFFGDYFEKDLYHWREKKLNSLQRKEISSVRITQMDSPVKGKKQTLLTQKENHKWTINNSNSTEGLPADQDRVEDLNQALSNLKAKAFLFEDKNQADAKTFLKKAKNTAQIQITTENKEGISIFIYNEKNNSPLYATLTTKPGIYELESSFQDHLKKTIKDYRITKLISGENRFSVKSAEFSSKNLEHKLVMTLNEKEKWEFFYQDKPVDYPKEEQDGKAMNVLDQFFNIHITDFLPSEKTDPAEEFHVLITYKDQEDKKLFVFWEKDKKLFCKNQNNPKDEIFLMDNSVKSFLPWTMKFFEKTGH